MSLAVVDASVLAAFYASDDPRRPLTAARLSAGELLFAPAHLDAEVISALRGMARGSSVLADAVPGALRHLAGFPIRRVHLCTCAVGDDVEREAARAITAKATNGQPVIGRTGTQPDSTV